MEQLIIQALKSACGNRNIKFQVIVQDEQLHIYANHRQDYQPSYLILEENVRAAIASLALDKITSFWLYGRPLNQVEPNWQVFRELTNQDSDTIEDTDSNDTDIQIDIQAEDLEYLAAEIDSEIDSEIEIEGIGNFDFLTNGTTGDARLLLDQSSNQKNLLPEELDLVQSEEAPPLLDGDSIADVVSFSEAASKVSTGDTGLLLSRGLIHGSPLKEAEIGTCFPQKDDSGESTEGANFSTHNKLAQYCFISDHQLLTEKATAPSKEVMRLVKFFHYLAEEDQQQLAPIVESYLRDGLMEPCAEPLPAIQNWLTKISALGGEEQSTFALWLSRYCFAPTVTLEEFKTIAVQNAAGMNIKEANRATEYSFVPVKDDSSLPVTIEEDIKLDQGKFQLPPRVKQLVKQLILPGIWILVTMILILVGIMSHNSPNVATSAEIPALCKNTIGNREYCRLAVDLAGEKAIAQAPKSLFPLTEVTESIADYGCARYANLKSGMAIAKIDPETTPVISSHGEKVFPHIYVVEAEQKNPLQLENTKVGCVYTTGQGQRSPKKLAADLIPVNWPTEQYQQQTQQGKNHSFGRLAKPITLGLSTIFAALGIAIASWLNLGLKVHRTHTIYLVALLLGMVQLGITQLMPANFLGLLGGIIFPILAILMASLALPDFQLNGQRGYGYIAISVLAILAIEFLLYSLCLELISSLI
ncbi:MAG: hypothetical protein RLZZ74_2885 [Cyanobacteriota bacterium]